MSIEENQLNKNSLVMTPDEIRGHLAEWFKDKANKNTVHTVIETALKKLNLEGAALSDLEYESVMLSDKIYRSKIGSKEFKEDSTRLSQINKIIGTINKYIKQ